MKARGIITGSLVITLIIGCLNSIYKTDKLPSFRFFFGSGVLFLMLTVLADWEEEIAKALALAIVTFTVLGEGGGVLDHFMGSHPSASKTTLNTDPKQGPVTADIHRQPGGLPTTVAASGLSPIKPVIPNGVIIHSL